MSATIPATVPIRRFNDAVESFDRMTNFRFDQCDAAGLYRWLVAADYKFHASEIAALCRHLDIPLETPTI